MWPALNLCNKVGRTSPKTYLSPDRRLSFDRCAGVASVTQRTAQIANRPTHGGTVKKTAIAGVIVGAVVLASGCSSSSDQSAPTSSGPAKVAPPAILQAGTLKICAPNDGTPPRVYHDETGALVGSEVDLGKAIAGNLGLTPQFVESAFAAVIPTLQAKQCDVIMAQLYVKPEREKVVDFVPYVWSGTGIAVSKEHPAA